MTVARSQTGVYCVTDAYMVPTAATDSGVVAKSFTQAGLPSSASAYRAYFRALGSDRPQADRTSPGLVPRISETTTRVTERFGPRPAMVAGLLAVASALFLLTSLQPDSGYDALWPAFTLLGAGIGLVLTASSDAIVGNASVDDAGVAGGLQSTAVQLGGVLGTTILGSVLSSRVGTVLVGELTAAGTPEPLADKLIATKQLVAQGVAPSIPGAPAPLSAAIAEGSHNAFMAGLHTSLVVAASAAAVGAVLAMFVRR